MMDLNLSVPLGYFPDFNSNFHILMDGDDLRFYVLFNAISVISGDNARHCPMEPVYD